MDEGSVLISTAMKIIMFAGNARTKANTALDYLKEKDFAKASECIAQARQDILSAHREQTDIIQAEAGGECYEVSLIFIHAQDTLMTIMTEVNLAEKMIMLFEAFMN